MNKIHYELMVDGNRIQPCNAKAKNLLFTSNEKEVTCHWCNRYLSSSLHILHLSNLSSTTSKYFHTQLIDESIFAGFGGPKKKEPK